MDLKERARALELDKSYGFPKAPNALSGALRRLEPALRDLGITVERGREGPDGQRMIRIRRKEDDTDVSSSDPTLN